MFWKLNSCFIASECVLCWQDRLESNLTRAKINNNNKNNVKMRQSKYDFCRQVTQCIRLINFTLPNKHER